MCMKCLAPGLVPEKGRYMQAVLVMALHGPLTFREFTFRNKDREQCNCCFSLRHFSFRGALYFHMAGAPVSMTGCC